MSNSLLNLVFIFPLRLTKHRALAASGLTWKPPTWHHNSRMTWSCCACAMLWTLLATTKPMIQTSYHATSKWGQLLLAQLISTLAASQDDRENRHWWMNCWLAKITIGRNTLSSKKSSRVAPPDTNASTSNGNSKNCSDLWCYNTGLILQCGCVVSPNSKLFDSGIERRSRIFQFFKPDRSSFHSKRLDSIIFATLTLFHLWASANSPTALIVELAPVPMPWGHCTSKLQQQIHPSPHPPPSPSLHTYVSGQLLGSSWR